MEHKETCLWKRVTKGEAPKAIYGWRIVCGCSKCKVKPRMSMEIASQKITIDHELKR